MTKLLRILLFPFSLVFLCITGIRNFLYQIHLLKSSRFDIPTIGIGNLSVGGTGKSPHTEYLIRLLEDEFVIGTMSRGYGRKTKGYLAAGPTSSGFEIGDEPAQFKRKFPSVHVAVDENRVRGIMNMVHDHPELEVVLLDDVYQHRAIKPGLMILLTEYNAPFFNDFILPLGNLRETRANVKRADIIVVTKCPEQPGREMKNTLLRKIGRYTQAPVYFSSIAYGEIYPMSGAEKPGQISDQKLFVVTGIANPDNLLKHLKTKSKELLSKAFPDHHKFNERDIAEIEREFNSFARGEGIIITTEKDAMRLLSMSDGIQQKLKQLPIYIQPIHIKFEEADAFNNVIYEYVRQHKGDNQQN